MASDATTRQCPTCSQELECLVVGGNREFFCLNPTCCPFGLDMLPEVEMEWREGEDDA